MNGTCYGGMSKEVWYSDQRATTCINVFTQMVAAGNVNESTAGLNICDLNSDLNNMCIGLKSAQTMVFEANCIYSGDCSPRIALYTPGMYSISNGDFVRGTVSNYYETYNQNDASAVSGQRVVCPLDSEEEAMRLRNSEYTSECASVQLQILKVLLGYMRNVLHMLVQAAFIIINLIMNLLRLCVMTGENMQPILNDIQFWFMKLINLLVDLLKVLGDMMFSIIFDTGGLGSAMKEIVKALCNWVNWVYHLWNDIWCGMINKIAIPLVDGIKDLFWNIKKFLPFLGIGDVYNKLKQASDDLKKITCTYTNLCNFPDQAPPAIPSGALPTASRCWANYVAEIDDTNSLSCSRSDTCRSSVLTAGAGDSETSKEDSAFMVCDRCPRNSGVNQFGCNTYTQQCTCSQPVLDRTYCTTNAQCYLQGDQASICAQVNDFTTGGSFGSLECNQCSSTPTCHILEGSGVGVCSCMQQETPVQSCNGPLGDYPFLLSVYLHLFLSISYPLPKP